MKVIPEGGVTATLPDKMNKREDENMDRCHPAN